MTVHIKEQPACSALPLWTYGSFDKDALLNQLYCIPSSQWSEMNATTIHQWIPEGEQQRAKRFVKKEHQQRFIAGRLALRMLASRILHLPAHMLKLETGKYRKPFFEISESSDHVHFSLSYSGDWVIIGFDNQPIGIDIESINPAFDVRDMLDVCCSTEEIMALKLVSPLEQRILFFNLWTRKEALLKWSGKGIGTHLTAFSVLEGRQALSTDLIGALKGGTLILETHRLLDQAYISIAQSQQSSPKKLVLWA